MPIAPAAFYRAIFLEHLGLCKSKLKKRAKNEAKNRENLNNSQRAPLSLFGAELLHNIITFSIEYACKISANFNDTFCKLGVFDVELLIRYKEWRKKSLNTPISSEKFYYFSCTHREFCFTF